MASAVRVKADVLIDHDRDDRSHPTRAAVHACLCTYALVTTTLAFDCAQVTSTVLLGTCTIACDHVMVVQLVFLEQGCAAIEVSLRLPGILGVRIPCPVHAVHVNAVFNFVANYAGNLIHVCWL